ncbi:MAG: RnfABCDGE type electron transport complex subunit D [Hominimerdicola sp.]
MEKLNISPSPHIRDNNSTSKIMTNVIIALVPALLVSGLFFGGRALMLTGFCIISAMAWEGLFNIILKRPSSTNDISAAVTGMILAFNLPVTTPYWIALIGTFIAIVIAKQLFGGLGKNFVNPAILGIIALSLLFHEQMTTWAVPFYDPDAILTDANPLVTKSESYLNLFIGNCCGNLGEVSAFALLVGGIYLCVVRVISPHAPLAFIGTVLAFSYILNEDGIYQILAGGVMLGAIFMASDSVTTPITKTGKIIFGIGCGLITCIIRLRTPLIYGVPYAILIMNILTPLIDRVTRKKPLGAVYKNNKD